MKTLEEKQHYITSHISEEEYEGFYDYVGEVVGNFDIEKWPSEFLVDVPHGLRSWLTSFTPVGKSRTQSSKLPSTSTSTQQRQPQKLYLPSITSSPDS